MNKTSIISLLNYCRVPIFLLSALALLTTLGWMGIIPSLETLVAGLRKLLDDYGYLIIAPASFLENLAIVNFVFPGSIVILTAMALTVGDPVRAFTTFVMIWIGSFFGLIGSFFLGKLVPNYVSQSHQISEGRNKLIKQLFLTFWHPQFASMTCFAIGAKRINLFKLLVPLILVNLIWNIFWGLLIYNVGSIFNDAGSIKYLLLIVLISWITFNTYCWNKKGHS